ncbi:MAG TPA: asparagine synthase C-terminal domain-containing protein [Woeseiaceae bacterium]|nr:asparagine synthase C-terminal domain-containing protein [Woeseiaceae bacterium]
MTREQVFFTGLVDAGGQGHIEVAPDSAQRRVVRVSVRKKDEVEVVVLGRSRPRDGQDFENEESTCADTIIRLWRQHGHELLPHLRGHFALAVIDSKKKQALLAVDRFVSLPVYWAKAVGGGFGFGTSLKDVARQTGNTAVDSQAIYDYVYAHVIPGPASIYSGVQKLPPASLVLFTPERSQVIEYWRPSFSERDGNIDERGRELLELIREAVGRDIASSPTGCFLSGGLDSSTVAGMHSQIVGGASEAFTIGFDAPGYDEMQYSKAVAKHFDLRLHDYYLSAQDIVDCMPQIAAAYDEPFGNSSAVAVFVCARLARESGMSVLLAGDGGDELFGGNERYRYQQYFHPYEKLPRMLRQYAIDPLARLIPTTSGPALLRKAGRYFEQARVPLPDRLEEYNFLHRNRPGDVFDTSFLEQLDTSLPLVAKRERYAACAAPTSLQRLLYLDWKYTLADNDLRKVGTMCRLAGIEVRYPLLDDDIVDFACELPAGWLIRGNDLRHFYRRAVADFLPQKTLAKSKHGFGLPFGLWLRTHTGLRELVGDSIVSLRKREIFRGDFLDRMQNDHRTENAAYYGELIWILTMLELWFASR